MMHVPPAQSNIQHGHGIDEEDLGYVLNEEEDSNQSKDIFDTTHEKMEQIE